MIVKPWVFQRGSHKVYTEDVKKKQKLDGWKLFKCTGWYSYPDGRRGWDYTFPSRFLNRVVALLGLPLEGESQGVLNEPSTIDIANGTGDFSGANSNQTPTSASESDEPDESTPNA